MSELIGKSIDQYQIIEQIGEGGMATIFLARQSAIDRDVAIKVLSPQLAKDANFVKRFIHEAKAIAALEHPHILPVHDFGTKGDLNYLVMRYVKGGTLSDLMGNPMPYRQMVNIVRNVARALDYAHKQGVVHRDIKPSNILVDEHREVLLTDFGIAKLVADSGSTQLTAAGTILGTPAYMAPEQAQAKEIDGRTDIYSLGVVLYELLTGRQPYRAETPLAVALKHMNDPLPLPRTIKPDIPEALERVVVKAMQKSPDQRYETAAQMELALRDALKEIEGPLIRSTPSYKTQTVSGVSAQTTTSQSSKSSFMLPVVIGIAIIGLLLCLLGGGLVTWVMLRNSDSLELAQSRPATATATTEHKTLTPTTETSTEDKPTTATSTTEHKTPTPTPTIKTATEDKPTSTPGSTVVADIVGGIDSDNDELPETETPTPPGKLIPNITNNEILFAEHFDSEINNWPTGQFEDDDSTDEITLENGKYSMYVAAKRHAYVEQTLPDQEFSDFILTLEAEPQDTETYYTYGVSFRETDEGHTYTFQISNDNLYAVQMYSDDGWKVLKDWSATYAIKSGHKNELQVIAQDDRIAFFVNDHQLAVLENDTFDKGSVGLIVNVYNEGESTTVDFDNLVIRAIEDEELLAPPTCDHDISGEVIFAECFNSETNGWSTGQFDDEYSQTEYTIEDGKYTINVLAKDYQPYVEKNLPLQDFSDFILTLDATPQDLDSHYSYGLAFREDSEEGHTYTFQITNDGLYSVHLYTGNKFDGNKWKILKEWSTTNVIRPGQTNALKVIADGDIMSFFINDELLIVLENDVLSHGRIGLIVDMYEQGKSTAVNFDNVIVRPLGDERVVAEKACKDQPSGDIIFAECFDSDINGWVTGLFEDELKRNEYTIAAGKYTLDINAKEQPYIEKNLPYHEFSDFILTIDVIPYDSESHYAYGIAFRENRDAGHTYTFQISNDGLYSVQVYSDDGWLTLQEWSDTDAIKIDQTNELKVIAEGEVMTFFINDELLTTLDDDTLPKGRVGVIISMFEDDQSASVDFDNLIIRPIE